jgi:hypothetical protein
MSEEQSQAPILVPSPESVQTAPVEPTEPSKRGRKSILGRPLTQNERTQRSRQKSREKKNAQNFKFDSGTEPTKAEARSLLELRGLKNDHVIKTTYSLLMTAAQENGIPANRFLFANGIKNTLESIDAAEARPLEDIPVEPVTGELLTRPELYALYDTSISWREELSFDEFLDIRHTCKTNCFLLGRDILQKDFAQIHETWSEFFPRFDPDTLPPAYNQRQAIEWMKQQADTKNFLMLASRASFKSSWSHVWLLSLILCLPDIRVLLVSETRPLALDFIGVIRSYFETVSGQDSRFLHLFPEFAITSDDGSKLSLDVPTARLRLAQSIESTSMDSAVAGRRADIILFDDPISSTSCENEEQRAKSVKKFDALCKLREAGSGLVAVLGTPWAHDDLYAKIIERNDNDPDKPWAVRIDPAWTRKPDAVRKKLRDLVEDDVNLLFPERLTWKFLQSELRQNETFFMSQNLVIFPEEENSDLKVEFSEEDLLQRTVKHEFFSQSPLLETVMSIDTAFSTSRFADFSCIATLELRSHYNKTVAVVKDVVLDRLKQSELAVAIVEAIMKHSPHRVVIEKDGPWESLAEAIKRAAMLRNVVLPYIFWRPPNPGNKQNAKAKRVKALEPMIPEGTLWFIASAIWNEQVIAQFTKFDGVTKSNSSRKDDSPDAVAIGIESFFPRTQEEKQPTTQQDRERQEEEEKARQQMMQQDMYRRMFGDRNTPPPKPTEPEAMSKPTDPRLALFGGRGIWRM